MIQALSTRVLLKLAPREKMYGKLYIPDPAQVTGDHGTVINIGELVFNLTNDIDAHPFKVGDVVYFARYAGASVNIEDDTDPTSEYLLIDASDLYGKLIP